jgi:hypothetical protein
MHNISNRNKLIADCRKDEKNVKTILREPPTPQHIHKQTSELYPLRRDKLFEKDLSFCQLCPQTKLQEKPHKTPRSMHHPELAFANVPFLKNRSLN